MYEIKTENILKAQNDDNEALTNIIQTNSGLIWSIVKRFLGRGYEGEELYQIGCIGFIKAIKRFNVEFDVKLSTYAVPYILGEIKRFLRDDGMIKVSRSIKELACKINEIQREYLNKNGEEISVQLLAQKLGKTKEEIIMAQEIQKPLESIDEEVYKNESSQESKITKINLGKNETDTLINKLCLNKLINDLDKREQTIIILRYYKEKTQTEVAKMLGISQVQVSRIEKKVLLNMREKII